MVVLPYPETRRLYVAAAGRQGRGYCGFFPMVSWPTVTMQYVGAARCFMPTQSGQMPHTTDRVDHSPYPGTRQGSYL